MRSHDLARWWLPEGNAVRCELCPHRCLVRKGGVGICGVRKNVNGTLRSLNYGRVSVMALDNIEKKPVFHYRPGSTLLSVGTMGCNLDCGYCQNFQLARGTPDDVPWAHHSPEALVKEALEKETDGIAWTFNEPVIWAEFVIDTSKLAREKGLYSMVNTNGFVKGKAREELLGATDAIKVDVKAFTNENYAWLSGGSLDPVLETCAVAKDRGVHIEVAYLMIPGINDSPKEMGGLFKWITEILGSETPLHLFRFSPSYKMKELRKEPLTRMRKTRAEAMEAGLEYVYFGGVVSAEEQNTRCPRCGFVVVSRVGKEAAEKVFVRKDQMSRFCPSYSDVKVCLEGGRCPRCGEAIKIRFA